jgi:hypothetical protein
MTGCSTGVFLQPEASYGNYSAVNPSCPGAQEVIEFSPQNQYWVLFRVYATPPGRWNSNGTELRIHFRLVYQLVYRDGSTRSISSVMFMSEEREKLIRERSKRNYLVTVSKPTVTVIMPDNSVQEISIPIFERPHDPRYEGNSLWDPGIQISPKSLEQFTVKFPDIYVNGEKIDVPHIQFKKNEQRYFPVINC